jgi:hypothetical protein
MALVGDFCGHLEILDLIVVYANATLNATIL